MGKVKKFLARVNLERPVALYCGIELCETIHFHMPTYRFELTAQQFAAFAKTVQEAFEKWVSLGKPETAEFIPLSGGYLPGPPVYPNRFEIEEQTIPLIHVHIRGLSIRLSIPHFKEIAAAFEEANKNLE